MKKNIVQNLFRLHTNSIYYKIKTLFQTQPCKTFGFNAILARIY